MSNSFIHLSIVPAPGDFQAWNACLNHILALAHAHIESVTYAALSRAVDGCIDPDCRRCERGVLWPCCVAAVLCCGCAPSNCCCVIPRRRRLLRPRLPQARAGPRRGQPFANGGRSARRGGRRSARARLGRPSPLPHFLNLGAWRSHTLHTRACALMCRPQGAQGDV